MEPQTKHTVRYDISRISDDDKHYFNEGSHNTLYNHLGSHVMTSPSGERGVYFAVWAPDAHDVSVIGDFNGWQRNLHNLQPSGSSGIWEGFITGIGKGTLYKYHVASRWHGYRVDKTDPFGFFYEISPKTASIVWDLDYDWNDQKWMTQREHHADTDKPMCIYEMHIGSWMRVPEENNRSLSYREMAEELANYIKKMGYTHVEFMPVMEHPFYGSWGYQCTGFFAPTSRFGTPQDFMYLVDVLHQNDIGIIMDWVPSHFPTDEHGLAYFDGTHLYEHADPRQGFHPDWGSYIFNYGRNEIRSFLLSSANFWLQNYHTDGLRVDAVASMLYLDYSRKEGEWVPNQYGGNENIEAIEFLRRFNSDVYSQNPGIQTIAEESTAWPMVSRPTYVGGLGFGYKWDMGWMHDFLKYMSLDPIFRKYHHNQLTFRMLYAFTENYVLSISHDEVVHGKGSMLGKMPGDDWQKFANLRLLFGTMYAQPGKKLMFMGSEFGQGREWAHDSSLDWHLLAFPLHKGLQKFVADINNLYRTEKALHVKDTSNEGFEWVDCNDSENSTLSFLRKDPDSGEQILVVMNFTPIPRHNHRIGVNTSGDWKEILNSDAKEYAGSGQGNFGGVKASPIQYHGRPYSVNLILPPLGITYLKKV